MKLTRRLIFALTCAILLVLGINALVRVKREAALFENDIRRDTLLIGRALAGAASRIWATVGDQEALDLIEDADNRQRRVLIRWIGFEDSLPAHLPADARERWSRGEELIVKVRDRQDSTGAIYAYVPVALPGVEVAALELRESLAAERRYVKQTIVQAVLATGALVLVCSLVVAAVGIFFVGRPVARIVGQARRIGAGDLSPEPAPDRGDEIGELAREMNAMCERLAEARRRLESEITERIATQEQLRHADRLNTVGKLAAGVAHEVGTPLNVMSGYAQMIREEYPPGTPAHEHSAIVTEQIHRVTHIVSQLLDFARQRRLQKGWCDLAALVGQVVSLLESLAQKLGVTIELERPPEPLEAEVDAGPIQQVVTNLVVNAIQASGQGDRVRVGIEARAAERPDAGGAPGDYAVLYVEDRGSGIPEDVVARIFEPFFTTKQVGEGTGLGLSVAHGIIEEHGGWIDVQSRVGEGSRFSVYLPLKGADE